MADEKEVVSNTNDKKDALESHVNDSERIGNDSTVKFLGDERTSEVSIVDKDKRSDEEFVGLTKEELMKYASDPFWRRLRIVLMVLFVVGWVVMLAAAVAIIVVAPKCPPRPDLDWWQKTIVYHVHPQSFLASNRQDFGDINGIHDKLGYLKDELHVDAVCIGPMNPTPNFKYGYNIIDYDSICRHHYGSYEDFEKLRVALHKKSMKLILDFIPNHTSRKHPWFKKSSKNESSYADFYIWHPGSKASDGTPLPPNDWHNVFGESAWTHDPDRQEYYYHAYSEDEPDLNLTNPAVIAELDASLKLWLDRGVDGFRFYGVEHLVESANLTRADDMGDDQLPPPTSFQPQSYELVTHWRELLDDYSHNDGKSKTQYYPRVLIAEVSGSAEQTAQFMKCGEKLGAHIATNVALTNVKKGCTADCVHRVINDWYTVARKDELWSNWQLGSVDTSRVASRMGDSRYVNVLNMLLLTLPGTAMVYYGEEIGMKNVTLDSTYCEHKSSMDNPCHVTNRAPMQWSDGLFAGFTTGNSTWIEVCDDYHSVNVEAQLAHGSGVSALSVFAGVSKLREEPSFQWGEFYAAKSGNIYYYVRQAERFDGYLVAINLGPNPSTVDFTADAPVGGRLPLPSSGEVVATTGNFAGAGRSDAFKLGTAVEMSGVYLEPGEGIILSWPPEALDA